MSLDVMLTNADGVMVYEANITHNLTGMADAAGIYMPIWRPDEVGIRRASQLIDALAAGLLALENDPDHFSQFNAPNSWGMYKHFVPFVEQYLEACRANPDATVSVYR